MRDAYWLLPSKVFDGKSMHGDLALYIEGQTVLQWAAKQDVPETARRVSFQGIAAPGLIDLQVNGGGGVLFNTSPTVDGLKAIANAHRKLGCAYILPTLITDAPEVLDQAVEAMLDLWCEDDHHGVVGIHIEGPHISTTPKRGTHSLAFIRPLDEHTLTAVARLRKADIPVLLTLAPEATRPGQIAQLTAMGCVVSVGHSAANSDDMRRAFAEGVRKGTHLFNGMSGMAGREPGVAGHHSDAYLGIIADGHHVSETMIRLAWRARPITGRMILVSDAMPTVGGPDHFVLYGNEISVADGKLVNNEGSLAGVHMALPEAIGTVTRILGDDGSEALAAASSVPAELMGLSELGHLRPGAKGGIVLFDEALQYCPADQLLCTNG